MTNKSLKEVSLQDIEIAVAKAISELIGTEVETNISEFNCLDVGWKEGLHNIDRFDLKLSLKIGKETDYGESGSF